MSVVNYLQAVDAAIVLDYAGANEGVVKGLNKLGLPGMSRKIITVDEFRNEWARKFVGGGEYDDIGFGGNFVTGDEDGQDALKQHWLNKTKLIGTDILFFLNMTDFFATDLANDSEAGFQIADIKGGEADKNSIYTMTGKAIANGRIAVYTAHMTEGATPTLAFDTTGSDKVTDSGSGFVTAGYKAGQTLMIVGSTSNDDVHAVITTVAAGQLDLDVKSGTLTAESGITGMEIHGGSL